MKRGVTGLFLLLATACVVGGCGAKKDAQKAGCRKRQDFLHMILLKV